MIARRLPVAAMVLVLAAAACRKSPPPPPAPSGPTAAEMERARQDSIARARARQDSLDAVAARERAEAERMAAAQREARAALEARVHFEYDQADITAEAERILRDKVDVLRANPGVRLRIEGHADERGSTEYNLALASRRAESVRQFLTGFGLDAARFATVSFGEERPLVNRSDEAAWAQNRRAEFVITAGGGEITPAG